MSRTSQLSVQAEFLPLTAVAQCEESSVLSNTTIIAAVKTDWRLFVCAGPARNIVEMTKGPKQKER